MAGKTDARRLVDLKATLKKAKPKDVLTLEACSALWGVAKPRFVNVCKNFVGWPDPIGKEGNTYLLPAKKCLEAMLSYLERHRTSNTARAKRLGELIGTDQMAEHIEGGFSIAELAKANQLATEFEARARDQGLYAPIADIQRVVGMVFSEISEFVSNLSNIVDPHGRLPPEVRALIDSNGHEQLLRMHSNLKGMLSSDVVDSPTRKPAGKPRKAPARRKRPRGNPRKA